MPLEGFEFADNCPIDLKTEKRLPNELCMGIQKARNASKFAHPRRSHLYVGAAVSDENGTWWPGGNVEILWQRCHHAEENAIISALGRGAKSFGIVVVSAPRKLFTPCGGCCDLIMEFSTDDCIFVHDNPETEVATLIRARSLMPFYPTRS